MRSLNLIREALLEDIGSGDVTAKAVVPAELKAKARIVAKQDLVVCGTDLASLTFKMVDPTLKTKIRAKDGKFVKKGSILLEISGNAQSILSAERTALNFLQRLSGISTLTRRFVRAVKGTRARILDTRKTTPGWRYLEKYAVKTGGGTNHRIGLFDMYLIKNNHVDIAGSVTEALLVANCHNKKGLPIEVEVRDFGELEEAVIIGADVMMLDNFTPKMVAKAVKITDHLSEIVRARPKLEASGGITLKNVRAYARSGIDFISVGELTHSAPAADLHLRVINNS